jgi:predicted metalloprotease with PDZ domain
MLLPMRKIAVLILTLLSVNTYSQTLTYKLELTEPHKHYYYVTMVVDGWKKNTLEVKMPVWAPGSYLIREFAKGVDYVKASSGQTALTVSKTDKNTWQIKTEGKSKIEIRYNVYAFETSVRTSYLDAEHGFVSGSSVFMYIPEMKTNSGTLEIVPGHFKRISTTLKSTGATMFTYSTMDELYDCPIEIGNHEEFDFMAAGCHHRVAMFGSGNYEVEKLKKDMAVICEEATKVWGENPNKEYLFIIHNLTVGSGGLEHASSTTLDVSRNTYGPGTYTGFLSIVAHEYFHLWNVKRLRPAGLFPYDYDKENYTDLLWVAEGFTSYYDELLLKRAGYYDEGGYIRSLNSTVASVENTPGSKIQSATESSYDAWIKGYRPNENTNNRTISYYPKGTLIAAMLDIEIISSTNGKMKLDDLMRKLYNEFYKVKKTGYTLADFKAAAESICGKKLDDFFNTLVLTAGNVNYNEYLNKVGYMLIATSKGNDPWLGVQTKDGAGGRVVISAVSDGSCAQNAGLFVNDEIIAVNNNRVDNNSLYRLVGTFTLGATLDFLISRDNLIQTVKVKLDKSYLKDFVITPAEEVDKSVKALKEKWLN